VRIFHTFFSLYLTPNPLLLLLAERRSTPPRAQPHVIHPDDVEGPQFSVFMAELLLKHNLFLLVTRSIQSIVGFWLGMYVAYTNAVAAADRVQVLARPSSSGRLD
jgi:hypothetical protein